ncbi:dihydrofolate reductase family protein [Larkinella ripae]
MRKIILDLAVTLDGFIEGPNGETDWCIVDEDMAFDDFLADIDAIFYGRVSYDLWGQYQPDQTASPAEKKLWKTVHEKEKYVFSRTPKPDSGVTYLSDDLLRRVEAIKRKPGKNIWLYGGASLITTFLDLNLIDVYRLAVHPVLLGSGKPLFSGFKNRVELTLHEARPTQSGVVLLRYETAR